jgi:hypothetical protein
VRNGRRKKTDESKISETIEKNLSNVSDLSGVVVVERERKKEREKTMAYKFSILSFASVLFRYQDCHQLERIIVKLYFLCDNPQNDNIYCRKIFLVLSLIISPRRSQGG